MCGTQKEEKQKAQVDFDSVIKFIEETIGKDRISKAEVSLSLADNPAMIAQGEFGMSPQMLKYMKARSAAMGDLDGADEQSMTKTAILQINPSHPSVIKLKVSRHHAQIQHPCRAAIFYLPACNLADVGL